MVDTPVGLPLSQTDAAPAVLELFTSQSCSSCPPADALAEELAQRVDVIVISRPVTYWNRIGWEDTLSSEDNTELQRGYARRGLEGRNGVYTPQAVIDGRSGVVGSRSGDVTGLLEQAILRPRPSITITADGQITVDGAASSTARLSIVAVDASETVSIASGENRNRSVTYTNSWLGEDTIGVWAGGKKSYTVPEILPEQARADRHALILREDLPGGAGPVLAGRWLN
ncbi:hypothetical protein AAV99_03675 [Aurantiacibacter marinus]|uniref:DUF1223 domain-containing protein n=1 Tax=Aurantiacibacter marinus TaxID=874156 RepID=A0A0H0XT82_9SPHN|nr:hypothetical protein AAV99_03675 [Aurantiacibacter marinus]